MKITTDKRIVSKGVYTVNKGKIAEVPEALAKEWIAGGLARAATPAEIAAADAASSKPAA